jgi:pimeloyl-ACP methyl ester carboxylesterase
MRVFEPIDGQFADIETGIVLFNQFGAIVPQDAGRDAQVLANSFNLPVIAVERPGTDSYIPHKELAETLSSPDGYLAAMSSLGKRIDRQVDNLGITKLITAGRSAGGLGALALARSETVSSLSAVFAAEPVACEQLPLKEGAKRYSDYLKQQKEILEDSNSEELVRPLSPGLSLLPAIGRLISIPPAMLIDRFHNRKLFASNAARQYATYIAKNLRLVDTTLVFAEHSMVAAPEVYEGDMLPIADLRTDGAGFEVKKTKGTVHASFDNRDYMNKVIEPTITQTLLRAA